MKVLVCVKRVPDIGAKFQLTRDQRAIETRHLGFTISPHEECAVEEAVQIVERLGGAGVALTLGPREAEEQLRDALARGMERAILLETDEHDWDPSQIANAIVEAIREEQNDNGPFDLILFGNESADAGNYQVPVLVAAALDLPCVGGIKQLEIGDGLAVARREIATGWEIYDLPLPAVIGVKEGLNLPRHPSLRGTMAAKRKPLLRKTPSRAEGGLSMVRLRLPSDDEKKIEILGEGVEAVPRIVELLRKLEVVR